MKPIVSFSLFLFAVALCFGVVRSGFAAQDDSHVEKIREHGQTRFLRTLYAVQLMPSETQALFATAALSELSLAYREEAAVALLEADQAGGERELTAWAATVDRYAASIDLSLLDLNDGFPVSFRVNAGAEVGITVADRTIMLSHPRLGEQSRYERQVLEHFCSQSACDELTGSAQAPSIAHLSAQQIKPLWSFAPTGPVCSYQRLSLEFSTDVDLVRARKLCAAVIAEAWLLAREIAWQLQHGVVVQWGALQLHGTVGRTQHALQLNRPGDTVIASLPIFYRTEGLLQKMVPWIREAAKTGKTSPLRVAVADFNGLQDVQL